MRTSKFHINTDFVCVCGSLFIHKQYISRYIYIFIAPSPQSPFPHAYIIYHIQVWPIGEKWGRKGCCPVFKFLHHWSILIKASIGHTSKSPVYRFLSSSPAADVEILQIWDPHPFFRLVEKHSSLHKQEDVTIFTTEAHVLQSPPPPPPPQHTQLCVHLSPHIRDEDIQSPKMGRKLKSRTAGHNRKPVPKNKRKQLLWTLRPDSQSRPKSTSPSDVLMCSMMMIPFM